MDESLIREQEAQLQKTGRYYKHICFMAVPVLWMACFLYGVRPLLLCGIALLTGNLCDRLVALLRHRVYTNKDLSNESFSLIIALLMPATVDIYVLVVAVLAGVLIGKEVFGGYGSYPFNPAAVGRLPQLSINAAYQSHAAGFEDGGSTMYAGADMAFQIGKTNHGVGASFQRDEFGLFAHQRFSVLYAYHFRLFGGTLSVGASLDMLNEKVDGASADLGDANDPAFPTSEVSGSKFDFSAGLYYARGPLYAGIAAQHLTAPTVLLGETNEIKVKSLYNFTAGYNIRTRTPLFTIVPSTLLRYDGTAFRADITARLLYAKDKKRLYGGVNYSPLHSVAVFVGGMFHGVDISYSYEASTEGIGLTSGYHEVTIGYRLDLNLGKKGKNLHKSVRYL